VLQDLDKAIAALLKAELPSSIADNAAITFAAPDDQFPSSSIKLPAIDLFLFAIEENHELRSYDPIVERKSDGTLSKKPPLPRVDCHYMISAFPVPGTPDPDEDEHKMLGEVMRVLFRHRRLPDQVLQGDMAGQFTSVRALALAQSTNMRLPGVEMWQALKVRPRATIHYVLTISVDIGIPAVIERPATDVQFGASS